jgi:DNA-binding ferritin-like protein (Dps family)
MEEYDSDFQSSIQRFNKISDLEILERAKTIIPDLENFYLKLCIIESTDKVVNKIISEDNKDFIDRFSGEITKREWKNKRGRVNNCYDLISKIYFQNNELDKSFTYSIKIDDNENRIEQFKLIFDNLEYEDCIRYINSNEIGANASFFSNYLSSKIRIKFEKEGLEFSYLAKFNNYIDDFVNVFEYKIFNYCFRSKKLDTKKIELLNQVLDFNELHKIKSNILGMNS